VTGWLRALAYPQNQGLHLQACEPQIERERENNPAPSLFDAFQYLQLRQIAFEQRLQVGHIFQDQHPKNEWLVKC